MIDLEKILDNAVIKALMDESNNDMTVGTMMKIASLSAMREACEKTVDACAEMATLRHINPDLLPSSMVADKKSILTVKQQIK